MTAVLLAGFAGLGLATAGAVFWIDRYAIAANLLLGAWSIYFLFLLGVCLAGIRKGQFFLKVLAVLIFFTIFAGTTMPNETKNSLKQEVTRQVKTIGENAGAGDLIQSISVDITKAAHFGLFAVFGLVLVILAAGAKIYSIFGILLILAGGSELVQFFIDGRTPLAGDFAIDAAGGAAGVVLAIAVFAFRGAGGKGRLPRFPEFVIII